jgi:hypothetical protein
MIFVTLRVIAIESLYEAGPTWVDGLDSQSPRAYLFSLLVSVQPRKLFATQRRRVTEVRRPESAGPLRPYTRTRTPLSAERPDLGCSLPGLAGFAWQTLKTASLRKLPNDHQPQGTDGHCFGSGGLSGLRHLNLGFRPVL